MAAAHDGNVANSMGTHGWTFTFAKVDGRWYVTDVATTLRS